MPEIEHTLAEEIAFRLYEFKSSVANTVEYSLLVGDVISEAFGKDDNVVYVSEADAAD